MHHIVDNSRVGYIQRNFRISILISGGFFITGIFDPVWMVCQKPGNIMMCAAGTRICIPIKGIVKEVENPGRFVGKSGPPNQIHLAYFIFRIFFAGKDLRYMNIVGGIGWFGNPLGGGNGWVRNTRGNR